jgi:hypothetical protein
MPTKLIRGSVHITGALTIDGSITPALGTEYADNAFAIKDNGDATKKVAFQCSGITAGNTRTLTVPNYDGTLATLAGTETFTNKTLTSPKVGSSILDTNGAELFKITATGTAVNELTYANAATGGAPSFTASGDDTHISVKVAGKGNGKLLATTGLLQYRVATSNNTASNLTYTAAQLLGGLYLRDCGGGSRSDALPTAADLVAAIPGAAVGLSFQFILRNTSDAAETITVTAGAGCTISGTATVAQSNSKLFVVVLDNVGAGTEAYTIYSIGTFVH